MQVSANWSITQKRSYIQHPRLIPTLQSQSQPVNKNSASLFRPPPGLAQTLFHTLWVTSCPTFSKAQLWGLLSLQVANPNLYTSRSVDVAFSESFPHFQIRKRLCMNPCSLFAMAHPSSLIPHPCSLNHISPSQTQIR